MRGDVDAQVAQGDQLGTFDPGRGSGPPKNRLDSQYELSRAEGLGHVVVGSHFETNDAIDFVGSRREHDHGQTNGLRVPPKSSTDLDAGEVGQHDVEHQQVRLTPLDLGESGVTIMGDRDFVAGGPQVERNQICQINLVLDD
jgi:hypothetical protein